MRRLSFLFFLFPVWAFALGAIFMATGRMGSERGVILVGLGGLGITVANALMSLDRRILEIETRLDSKRD